MYFRFLAVLLYLASFGFAYAENLSFYKNFVNNKVELYNQAEFDHYFANNKDNKFTIGCLTKTITSAAILLFSLDEKNEYLFKNKELEITIGELLYNRKKYLESIKGPTDLQQGKLKFINKLLSFTDKKIMETQVYKILNHTSVFSDDFNQYLLYLNFQNFLKLFPEETQTELMFFGMQTFSLYFNKNDKVDDKERYSNMGVMYIIGIMDLMTDKKDFYAEVEDRIFMPIGLDKNFIRIDQMTSDELRSMFPNSNFPVILNSKHAKKVKNINIYDLKYTEMDTLNGGLITNLETAYTTLNEVIRLFLGMKNKISINEKIPGLFFKYRTARSKSNEFYSLGTIINFHKNSIELTTRGNVFGILTRLDSKICTKDNKTINKNYEKFVYNLEDFNQNFIGSTIFVDIKNLFLYNIFFDIKIDNFDNEKKEIIARTLLEKNTNYHKIENKINEGYDDFVSSFGLSLINNIDDSEWLNDYLLKLKNI